MAKAKFDEDTRTFIENLFEVNNYSLERQIKYLQIVERQKYNYYCDCSESWTTEECNHYNNVWNEILSMLDERKADIVTN